MIRDVRSDVRSKPVKFHLYILALFFLVRLYYQKLQEVRTRVYVCVCFSLGSNPSVIFAAWTFDCLLFITSVRAESADKEYGVVVSHADPLHDHK